MSSNRRKFLADSIKGLGALGITHAMSNLIIQSIASSAKAQTLSVSDKIYIFIHLRSGPPRWLFDLPLTPNGSSSNYTDHFSHQSLGTAVELVSGKSQVVYKAWRDAVSGYWLPPVWGSNPAGGTFTNCLSNAAFIRGVDYEVNGHELGAIRNQSPVSGGLSIAGVFSEKTNSVFNAAVTGYLTMAFKGTQNISPVGYSHYVGGTQNPISDMMSYFKGRTVQNSIVTTNVQNEFSNYGRTQKFEQKPLVEAKNKADALIAQGVQIFTDKWAPTFDKYKLKVREGLTKSPNISSFVSTSDLPRPSDVNGVPDPRIQYAVGIPLGGFTDLKDIVSDTATGDSLAVVFATIEILVSMGLTQTITTEIGEYLSLALSQTGLANNYFTMDQHTMGSLITTIGTSFYYRGILTCLEELIVVLKNKNLFDKTLIHIGSEFNRIPRIDGSGSDHGPTGSGCLLISGMIKQTTVVGNIKDTPTGTYAGSWGEADKHPINGGTQPIRLNDVARTICGMLGIKNVATNGEFVLKNNGVQWEAFSDSKGEAKNAA